MILKLLFFLYQTFLLNLLIIKVLILFKFKKGNEKEKKPSQYAVYKLQLQQIKVMIYDNSLYLKFIAYLIINTK